MKILFVLLIFSIHLSGYAQQKNAFNYIKCDTIKSSKVATINLSDTEESFDIQIKSKKEKSPNRFQYSDSLKRTLDRKRAAKHNGKINQQYNKTNAAPAGSLLNNFQGNFLMKGGTPLDNHVAVSNNGIIVSTVNVNLRIYNDTGKTLLYSTLADFGSAVGPFTHIFDPRVIYDPIEDKFIVMFLDGTNSNTNKLIVAFSKTNDPTGNWNLYQLPGNVRGDTTWSDYPMVGISKDDFFVTINLWNNSETCWDCDPTDVVIWQIDKASGYRGDSLLSNTNYRDIRVNNKLVWNICPIIGGSAPYGPNLYFLATRNIDAQNDSIFLIEITNTLASKKASVNTKVIKSNITYGIQPNAKQPDGSYLRTNFCDAHSGFYEKGKIQFVANSIDTATLSPGIYYGVISNPEATPVLNAKILSFDTLDLNFPSIAYAGGGSPSDNSAMINFLHVSPTTFAGISSVFVDSYGDFSPVIRVKEGLAPVNILKKDSIERWGDYTGIQRKYNEPGVCWLAGCFARLDSNLSTWIAKIKSNDPLLGIRSNAPVVLNSFELYPNPSASYLTLSFDNPEDAELTISVMDISGKLIKFMKSIPAAKGENKIEINTFGYKAGTYFMEIRNGDIPVVSKKFIVVN